METIFHKGVELTVCTHFKELQEKVIDYPIKSFLRKFYNRNQFFKYLLGKHIVIYEGEKIEEDVSDYNDENGPEDFGYVAGVITDCDNTWRVALYTLEEVTDFDYLLSGSIADSFFLDDGKGQIYAVVCYID